MDVVLGGEPDVGIGQYTFRIEDLMGHPNAGAIGQVAAQARYVPPAGGGGEGPAPRRNPGRARHRPAPSYDDIVGRDDEEDNSKTKKRKAFVNTGMPWRMEFIDLYGHPKDPSECFGCLYRTRRTKMTVPVQDMETIINLLRSCPAHMAPEALAVQVSEKQVEMARRINRTKAIDDPTRIPEWDPATVLDHLETHLMAPALYTRLMFHRMMRYVNWIEGKSLVRVDKHDGDESMDPAQLRCLKDVVQMAQSISKNQFKNMAFHSPGAVIQEEQVGGYVAQDAFRYFQTLKKRKRGF
jgi:hypothetical protein